MSFNFTVVLAEGRVGGDELADSGYVPDGDQLSFENAVLVECEHLSFGNLDGWTVITDAALILMSSDLPRALSSDRRVVYAMWQGVSESYGLGAYRDGAEERWLFRQEDDEDERGSRFVVEEDLVDEDDEFVLDEDSLVELVKSITGVDVEGDDLWNLMLTPLTPTPTDARP